MDLEAIKERLAILRHRSSVSAYWNNEDVASLVAEVERLRGALTTFSAARNALEASPLSQMGPNGTHAAFMAACDHLQALAQPVEEKE